jgi:hypothetical protein
LREADELRAAMQKAEEESRTMKMKRQESVKRREVETAKMKEETEAKAKEQQVLVERLKKAEDDMRAATECAEAIEAQRQAEIARKKELFELSNYLGYSFDLSKWVRHFLKGDVTSPEVTIEGNELRGKVSKTGSVNKGWKLRFFVLSMEDKALHYYESEATKRSKGSIKGSEILRVFAPTTSSGNKTPFAFLIETPERTYFCKTNSTDATRIWVAALSVFADHRSQAEAKAA